jgi:hypothetical protein
MISFAQYWTSRVKMGERLVASEFEAAAVAIGVLSASSVMRPVIRMTESMDRE